jgi:hypothetical protein
MPVVCVTSVMFGGPDLDRLYVTSMVRAPVPGVVEETGPLAGSLFVIDGLGDQGSARTSLRWLMMHRGMARQAPSACAPWHWRRYPGFVYQRAFILRRVSGHAAEERSSRKTCPSRSTGRNSPFADGRRVPAGRAADHQFGVAEHYGTSITPVREAIFPPRQRNRRWRSRPPPRSMVPDLTTRDLREIVAIRKHLEGMAAHRVGQIATPGDDRANSRPRTRLFIEGCGRPTRARRRRPTAISTS